MSEAVMRRLAKPLLFLAAFICLLYTSDAADE